MKRSRVNPVSKFRRTRDAHYQQQRRLVFERAEGRCEPSWSWDCTGTMTDVHHIAGRGGTDPHRLSNLLGCCRCCHEQIHRFWDQAVEAGFAATRHDPVRPSRWAR